jgi:hypothetical protein
MLCGVACRLAPAAMRHNNYYFRLIVVYLYLWNRLGLSAALRRTVAYRPRFDADDGRGGFSTYVQVAGVRNFFNGELMGWISKLLLAAACLAWLGSPPALSAPQPAVTQMVGKFHGRFPATEDASAPVYKGSKAGSAGHAIGPPASHHVDE